MLRRCVGCSSHVTTSWLAVADVDGDCLLTGRVNDGRNWRSMDEWLDCVVELCVWVFAWWMAVCVNVVFVCVCVHTWPQRNIRVSVRTDTNLETNSPRRQLPIFIMQTPNPPSYQCSTKTSYSTSLITTHFPSFTKTNQKRVFNLFIFGEKHNSVSKDGSRYHQSLGGVKCRQSTKISTPEVVVD